MLFSIIKGFFLSLPGKDYTSILFGACGCMGGRISTLIFFNHVLESFFKKKSNIFGPLSNQDFHKVATPSIYIYDFSKMYTIYVTCFENSKNLTYSFILIFILIFFLSVWNRIIHFLKRKLKNSHES